MERSTELNVAPLLPNYVSFDSFRPLVAAVTTGAVASNMEPPPKNKYLCKACHRYILIARQLKHEQTATHLRKAKLRFYTASGDT